VNCPHRLPLLLASALLAFGNLFADAPSLAPAPSLATAARDGLSREIASEIAYLSGIKPLTGANILGDAGGEPLAILCKATGLSKTDVHNLWRSMRRPEVQPDGSVHPDWERVQITYDLLAVDRAQTVLRYWNWSLSSALTPALLQAIRAGDDEQVDEYSAPERAAMLALAEDFGRWLQVRPALRSPAM
jgi:uncharacterized protein (DUF2336 family)